MDIDEECPFCGDQEENIDHLFKDRLFTKEV